MARFIIKRKVYDTEKMKLVGHVKKWYKYRMLDCELYRSKKGNFLLVRKYENNDIDGEAIKKHEAKELLMKCDYDGYVALFGELEEA